MRWFVADWYGVNVKAPPVEGQKWFNAEIPPWEDLLGRVTVLVFWAIGDEASLARIAQVQSLAKKHPNLVCIGVHTPRLPFEDSVENVASVIDQHNITIPVVHDPDFATWKRYNPEGWPTTVVIGDRLNVVGVQAGVDYFDTLEEAVWLSVNVADRRRTSPLRRLHIRPVTKEPQTTEPISHPSCVRTVDDDEIVVVDSGNNRLLFAELNPERTAARVTSVVEGFDGPSAVAVTNRPQYRDQIFVSEPANGTVIRYDRSSGERFVVADQLIRPTGLTIDHDGSLVVADSASEQLLRITNPHANEAIQLGLIGGNGVTGSEDGRSSSASLAQPTALARTEVGLVFCDAAASSLRLLTDSGKITTIIGDEFEWGHVDGPAHQARLQRPSDLAILGDGSIIITDTGNNRLRRLSKRRVTTVGPQNLNRVSSVCVMPSGHVVVADTGSNRLLTMNSSFKSISTLVIEGFETASTSSIKPVESDIEEDAAVAEQLDGTEGEQLTVGYPAPASGPWHISIHAEPASLLAEPVSATRNSSAGKVQITLGKAGQGHVLVRSTLERDSTVTALEKRALVVVNQTVDA